MISSAFHPPRADLGFTCHSERQRRISLTRNDNLSSHSLSSSITSFSSR